MHIAISIYMIFAVWRWGNWRRWREYHATMLFFSVGNLTYNFLCASYFLWRFHSDFLSNHTITEMLYTFIIFPATALIFLSRVPNEVTKVVLYILKWVLIYVLVELVLIQTKHISYQYGWNLYWSAGFDLIMFPFLYLHHRKPLIAYILAIPVAIFLIWLFDVPVHLPVEKR